MGVFFGVFFGVGFFIIFGFLIFVLGRFIFFLIGFLCGFLIVMIIIKFVCRVDKSMLILIIILCGMVFFLFCNVIFIIILVLYSEDIKSIVFW